MSLDSKIFLITGGTGFIGSTIVNKLIKQGCNNINIIDSNSNESIWRLDNKKPCQFYNIDLRDRNKLEKCIKEIKPEIIFHLAAYVNPESDFNAIDKAFSINFIGTKNLLQSLNDLEYELFINTGTSEEYGINVAPFKEDMREFPVSPYSNSKTASTYLCQMISKIYNKPVITVRPFLVYGPKQITISLIPSLISAGIKNEKLSLTPCEQTRDFIHVEDVAKTYIKLAKNASKVKDMGIFNIASGKETPIINVVELIKEQFPNAKYLIGDKQYRRGEAMHFYGSINKIRNAIKWEPKWNLEEGISDTIKWWQNNKNIWIKYKLIWE